MQRWKVRAEVLEWWQGAAPGGLADPRWPAGAERFDIEASDVEIAAQMAVLRVIRMGVRPADDRGYVMDLRIRLEKEKGK